MSHIRSRIESLRELVDEIKNAETVFERAALFSAIRGLIEDLRGDEQLNSYVKEKLFSVRWHTAAALGFDETNDNSAEEHMVWAYGEMDTLESFY